MENEIHCFEENQSFEKGRGILASQLFTLTGKEDYPFTSNSEVVGQDDINKAFPDSYKRFRQ